MRNGKPLSAFCIRDLMNIPSKSQVLKLAFRFFSQIVTELLSRSFSTV